MQIRYLLKTNPSHYNRQYDPMGIVVLHNNDPEYKVTTYPTLLNTTTVIDILFNLKIQRNTRKSEKNKKCDTRAIFWPNPIIPPSTQNDK